VADDSNPLRQKDAEPATRAANEALLAELPFDDRQDYEESRRGFVAGLPDGKILSRGGMIWNLGAYQFLDGPNAPPTVNPSLWRMAQLNMASGLFKVTDGVYQLRGLDIANMTVIEGEGGLILIDPLTTVEAAAAALELYYAHRPKLPVRAVIYSHSHVDHYGGVKGVASDEDVQAGRIAVIAPDGFMEAVGGENVLAGNAMTRRAMFQFGPLLPAGVRGQVDAGLGKGIARGRVSLIAPTQVIVKPVEPHTIAGVEIVFHLAPGTEAPAEMHMFMPKGGVLNMAENATRHLHNFCPLRGSVVRDPRMWAFYLADAIERFGDRTEVLIGQHHWPTWGRETILDFLARQRDLYKHVHDQTVRLMNHGKRPVEIAEVLRLPAGLARDWTVRGYYGTISHNSKAVYQRYLSWYDGHPANLNPLPPSESGAKYVEYMGGADKVIARARTDFAKGEYRFVAQVLYHVVFADPANAEARELMADALEQMGYQAESATWRNAYLFGALELRFGAARLPPRPILSPDLLSAVATDVLLDFLAVRIDPQKIGTRNFKLNLVLTDSTEKLLLTISNSTLTQLMGKQARDADATITMTRQTLVALIVKETSVARAIADKTVGVEGESGLLEKLFDALDDFELMFNILTP
jgi:alkyl sulfatase BDS1-like metallo-beta-lactamase superfamily hydrolase